MALPLNTRRLRLRPFCDDDAPLFAAYRSDPLIAQFQGWDAPYSQAQATRFVQAMQATGPGVPGQWYQIAIELRRESRLIGDCAFQILATDGRQAEIGFTLARAYHGRGYASEAVSRLCQYLFAEFQLHRLQAYCDVDNLASARLLTRLGMRREAHFVDNCWSHGEWRSEYAFGILRREWETARQRPIS